LITREMNLTIGVEIMRPKPLLSLPPQKNTPPNELAPYIYVKDLVRAISIK
jgi:hypothetical protein